jgi:protein-L-isoaspartate O-methyltransferase
MNLKSFKPAYLANHIKIILDRFRGLDFLSRLKPEDVGLDPNYAYACQPSGNKYLFNVLKDLNISSQDSIIDIGCGKGSAMRTMMKFPFAKIDGIELSDLISSIAKNNFNRLKDKRIAIFTEDASLFTEYESYNFIYFFNPFPSVVMAKVIDALILSIQKSERELIIIYTNPTCHDVIVKQGILQKIGTYPDKWKLGLFIYSNRNYSNSRLSSTKFMNLS